MTHRPRLSRSIPFWILVVGSLVSIAVGSWLVVEKIATMTSKLSDGSATGVEVYAGQSWVVFGAAFVAAGLIGLVAVLALAAARSFIAAPLAPHVAPAFDDATDHLVQHDVAPEIEDTADASSDDPAAVSERGETIETRG